MRTCSKHPAERQFVFHNPGYGDQTVLAGSPEKAMRAFHKAKGIHTTFQKKFTTYTIITPKDERF